MQTTITENLPGWFGMSVVVGVVAAAVSTAAVQLVVEKRRFGSADEALHAVGALLVKVLRRLCAEHARYNHRGSIRAHGEKLATILISEIENLLAVNAVAFLVTLDTEEFFKVMWAPPEVKDKAIEPMTSIREKSGRPVTPGELRQVLARRLRERLGVDLAERVGGGDGPSTPARSVSP